MACAVAVGISGYPDQIGVDVHALVLGGIPALQFVLRLGVANASFRMLDDCHQFLDQSSRVHGPDSCPTRDWSVPVFRRPRYLAPARLPWCVPGLLQPQSAPTQESGHVGGPGGFSGAKLSASLWPCRGRDAGATKVVRPLAISRCATADCDQSLLHSRSPAFSSAGGSDLAWRPRGVHLS